MAVQVIMQEDFELTNEIQVKANNYDWYTMYIDSNTQMKQAEERNNAVLNWLREHNVKSISNGDSNINL
jgi:hypothetical protein